jgi:hypothetical protein
LLSKNSRLNIQNYNFACCFYGCETWSLTLREERRLRVFPNRVLRRISGPKREDETGVGENYIMRRIMICIPHLTLLG